MYRLDYLPLCTIAGSDPTGGAGLQADLRTFAAYRGHGTAVATALTVQDRAGVQAVHAVAADVVRAQLEVVLAGVRPLALKTGMLASGEVLAAVADGLDAHARAGAGDQGMVPLIVDPVLSADLGGVLLPDAAIEGLTERLAPHACLLTPNLPEAARMLGRKPIQPGEEEEAAQALRARGWAAVLLKGGHGEGREVLDLLVDDEGVHPFRHSRLAGGPYHGTGCALSAALTALLGRGEAMSDAVEGATAYVQRLLKRAHEDESWVLAHLAVPTERPTP